MTSKGRIVLYHPQVCDSRRSTQAGNHVLPLSLLTVAAWPHHDGYEVVIIDGALYEDASEAHDKVVSACDGALVYGTTAMVGYQVTDSYNCAKRVKDRFPNLVTMIGGWWASVMPKMELESGVFDAVCMGQGEITFREFVQAVDAGSDLEEVAGLALLRDGELIKTERRPIARWEELLNCCWDLLDFEPYRQAQLGSAGKRITERNPRPRSFKEDRPVVTMVYHASFGCPEPCAFCCSPAVTNRGWRAMPADRMLDDIEEIQDRFDFDVLRFYDANWGVREKRTKEYCEGAIKRKLNLPFLALMEPFSVLHYDPSTVDLMAEAGCYIVNIGAEAGSDPMMERIGKHTAGDDNLQAAVELAKRDIDSYLTYIIGFPGEDKESMYATVDQARDIRAATPLAHPWIWIYQPIPGTPFYEQSLEEGFQAPQTIQEWGEFGEYHISETWEGRIPDDVLKRRQLFQHFSSLSQGLTRGKVGWWERRATNRLRSGHWKMARAEAKAFDVYLRGLRSVGLYKGGMTVTPSAQY